MRKHFFRTNDSSRDAAENTASAGSDFGTNASTAAGSVGSISSISNSKKLSWKAVAIISLFINMIFLMISNGFSVGKRIMDLHQAAVLYPFIEQQHINNDGGANISSSLRKSHVYLVSNHSGVGNDEDADQTVEAATTVPVQSCLTERGKSGKWILDWDYGNRSQYILPGSYSDWHIASNSFRPTRKQPYRRAASYRWEDDLCPVNEVSRDEFCRACSILNVTRLLILGDSLSAQFGMSLLSLLKVDLTGRTGFQRLYRRPHILRCYDFHVDIQLYRRSPLEDFMHLSTDINVKSFITDSPSRTIMVANTGLWINTFQDYQTAFHLLIDYIDSFPPDKLLAFVRPTIPGYIHCQPRPDLVKADNMDELKNFDWVNETVEEEPFVNLQACKEYTEQHNQMYNWNQIEHYNDYSYWMIQNRAMAKIHWLNIYPSAILRRDGHIGFQDCVHYYLPGPVDWWSHFFHSMLVDLAAAQSEDLWNTN